MNTELFNWVINFFETELHCSVRVARKLASNVDTAVFAAGKETSRAFIELMAFTVRNAYFEGEMA